MKVGFLYYPQTYDTPALFMKYLQTYKHQHFELLEPYLDTVELRNGYSTIDLPEAVVAELMLHGTGIYYSPVLIHKYQLQWIH